MNDSYIFKQIKNFDALNYFPESHPIFDYLKAMVLVGYGNVEIIEHGFNRELWTDEMERDRSYANRVPQYKDVGANFHHMYAVTFPIDNHQSIVYVAFEMPKISFSDMISFSDVVTKSVLETASVMTLAILLMMKLNIPEHSMSRTIQHLLQESPSFFAKLVKNAKSYELFKFIIDSGHVSIEELLKEYIEKENEEMTALVLEWSNKMNPNKLKTEMIL